MRRSGSLLLTAFVACALALAPSLAFARAGGSSSMGSRGSFTYSAPPPTATAPGMASPMQRSLTPQSTPSYGAPGYGAPGYAAPGLGASGFGGRSPFVSGLLGGLVGAGIGGMLFGHGMFSGISGFGGFLGFLLQVFLVVLLVRWLFRRFFRPAVPASGPGFFARMNEGAVGGGMGAPRPMPGGGGAPRPSVGRVAIGPSDFTAFEQLLQNVQAAWSAHEIARLQQLATPEMVSYFAEQLADQASRGVRNVVSDVRLEQGDLSEAWSENGRDYATVAMKFSMNDVTRDGSGRVVEGDAALRTMATELWTFARANGGRWLLSAIQQVR